MPIANAGGSDLYYETHGDGAPLLFVSGLGGTAAYWRPQIPAFESRYRVVLHDHRGTGRSERSRITYSVEQMADDTLGLMDALGIERAHLVGHSTGGAIGQILAVDHPERLDRLVIMSSWTRADGYFRLLFEARKEILRTSGPAAYARATALFLYPPGFIREHAARLLAEADVMAAGVDVEIVSSRIDGLLRFDRCADLGRIRTPTLVICARDDTITPAYYSEELARAIPGSSLVLLEAGGHACSQTVPEEFNAQVLRFLAG